jgi:hypothetical protein
MRIRLTSALLLLAGLTNPSAADIMWGINGHPITAYPGISIEEQIDYVADLGMTSYRINISYATQADQLAAVVRVAKARGIEILPVITPGNVNLDEMSEEALYEAAFELASGLATRFKDDISVFELGNEMENYAIIQPCEMRDDGTQYPCSWGPAGGVGPLEYYGPRWAKVSAVLKGLSDGVHSVDPEIKRAIGTAGWGHVGAFERMKKDGIGWDISVWHVYGEDPEWALSILADYDKPIWITELNNPFGSHESEATQAKELGAMMIKLKELETKYKVEAVHVYELLDEPYWQGFEASMGLVKLSKTPNGHWVMSDPKPAYQTTRDIIRGPDAESALGSVCDLKTAVPEPLIEHQVEYSYCLVLNRWPDGGGAADWKRLLATGEVSVYDMLRMIVDSEEFAARHGTVGMSNAAYVNFLYGKLLLREADPGGLATYVRELNTGHMDRPTVVHGIATSSEFAHKHASLFGKKDVAAKSGN